MLDTISYLDADDLERHFDDDGSFERRFDGPLWQEVHNAYGAIDQRRIEMVNRGKGPPVSTRSNFVCRRESPSQGG